MKEFCHVQSGIICEVLFFCTFLELQVSLLILCTIYLLLVLVVGNNSSFATVEYEFTARIHSCYRHVATVLLKLNVGQCYQIIAP